MTITELEERSGVARRTIHFYIREGLLPSPDKPGGGARYDEEHLLRLLLIRELQSGRYRLAEIRDRLDAEVAGLSRGEIRERLAGLSASATAPVAARGGVEDLQTHLAGVVREPSPFGAFSFADLARGRSYSSGPERTAPSRAERPAATPGGVGWVRFSIAEGVEVQVREDVLRRQRKGIMAWMAGYLKETGKGEGK